MAMVGSRAGSSHLRSSSSSPSGMLTHPVVAVPVSAWTKDGRACVRDNWMSVVLDDGKARVVIRLPPQRLAITAKRRRLAARDVLEGVVGRRSWVFVPPVPTYQVVVTAAKPGVGGVAVNHGTDPVDTRWRGAVALPVVVRKPVLPDKPSPRASGQLPAGTFALPKGDLRATGLKVGRFHGYELAGAFGRLQSLGHVVGTAGRQARPLTFRRVGGQAVQRGRQCFGGAVGRGARTPTRR